jgi:transcriptional regulator with XRE-family HTH domain
MSGRGPGRKPDLVDRAALAERLGVNASTVSRWQRRTVLPGPDVVLDGTDLWLWDTVREWARHRSRFRKQQKATPAEVAEIIHAGQFADRLGVDPRTIEIWHAKRYLPEPDYRWEAVDGWLGETIDQWAQTTLSGRLRSIDAPAESSPSPRSAAPSGPTLRVTAAVSAVLEPLKPSRPVPEQPAPPDAVPVTPTRKRSDDPVGDLDRLQRYFAQLAQKLREPAARG